jgi:hypothetical protein
MVADFSDMGYPSTYMCSREEILDIYQSLLDRLAPENLDFIVMEIADGLMQRETMFLLKDKAFMKTIHRTIFSCGDSLSAFHGVELLNNWGIEVALWAVYDESLADSRGSASYGHPSLHHL